MGSSDDVLRALENEVVWAREGSAAKQGEPYVRWAIIPDWGMHNLIEFECRDSIAVSIEGEILFDDDLDLLGQKGWIQNCNPCCLAFRLVYRDTGVRESLVFIRKDVVPPENALAAIAYLAQCSPEAARLRAQAAGAMLTSTAGQ